TPAKFGNSVRSQGNAVDYVLLHNESFKGAADFSPTGIITISSLVPLTMGPGAMGILTINQPLNLEYLTGITTQFALGPEHIANIDIALFASNENKIVVTTPGLINQDGGILAKVNQQGLKAVPTSSFFPPPRRLWKPFHLDTANNTVIGTMLLSTPLPDFIAQAQLVIGQAAASAVLALIVSFIFSTALSGSVYGPLRFLTQRARDLSTGKGALPPLEGLTGPWLELGELLDTSVASMRSSVQSLRNQLAKHNQDIEEKLRIAETASQQLDNVNRQLTDKTRQLAEISKQVNYANQQAVLLQHKLDSVLQISTEGYLILDQYGNVLSANPVFLNWMGVSEGEIAGQLCFDLVKKPGEPHIADLMPQAFARHGGNPADLITQFYPEGIVYHRYQDKTVEVLAHLQPVVSDDSNIQGYIMVLRDKSLRSEIAQLRIEIVAMLSDSIRAPLASAEPTWKTILSNAARTMHPSVGQGLVELHNHYEQLLGLVDSLLMMYGGILPPPMIPREQVIITRLAADCLEEVAAQAREHQLTLDYKTVTGLPPVNIDKDTTRRVTVQLLEKMIGITAPGGRVRVETLIKGNEMRMGIYSSGPALPQEEIEDMFAGFIEGKHKEETYSSRLSLYLARNNIERLGGRLWAESQEGRGTAIFFTINIA
ncbi:MAG: PAS domain-containing protein, partial [Candidatus Melainabacteria bacterium]|nr:PAS domain-containing protein [Candidatus Melainabacteria bacterium]